MSIQTYDPDMVERPGVEALATAGVGNLWRSLGRVWPLWSALTLVSALGAALSDAQGRPSGAGLQQAMDRLPLAVGSSLVVGLLTGVALRAMLDRGWAAWKPDLGLAAYALIVMLLGAVPEAVTYLVQVPAHGAPQAVLLPFAAAASLSLAFAAVLAWVMLRLTLWPIGLLMGDAEMTPGRSWALMRGSVLRYLLAALLLAAPVFILNLVVVMLTQPQGHLISQVAAAPLLSLMALLAAAVAAEIYRTRVRMQA